MTIEYTYGLEPIKYDSKSFDSVKESERRAAEHLQGSAGVVNPLETQIAFPSGLGDYVITDGGSGYLTPPTVTFVNSGSFRGSGATATSTVEAINPPATDGSVIGFTITNVGSGYTTIPKVVLTGNEIVTTFTDEDINITTDVFTKVAHGMSDGDRIHLTTDNVLPLGLYTTDAYGNIDANPDFYVRDATTDTFKLSKTSGGTAVDMWPRSAIGEVLKATGVAAGEPTSNMIVAIQVTGTGNDRGRRYSSAPTITIEAPPEGGTQATATCTLTDAGQVDRVTMVNRGFGYPAGTINVTFSGGHGTHTIRKGGGAAVTVSIGTGATAVPVTNATGVITAIDVTAAGSNYTDNTTVSITGGGGSGAIATAAFSSNTISSVNVTAGGTSYASLTSLANRLPPIQTNLNDEYSQTNTDIGQITVWINEVLPTNSIPNWTNSGYTDADLANVNVALTSYRAIVTTCKSAVDSMYASISSSSGIFRQHNERWCGLQDIGIDPFIPDYYLLMAQAFQMEQLKDELGVPFENYIVKILNCLFTGDDTIDTATGNILTNYPWSGTPYDLADYGVQSIISAGATSPSAIIAVINGFTTKVTAYETGAVTDSAAFAAHVTNDMAEYNAAAAFMEGIQDGKKHNGWLVDPYRKFVYPNVVGSQTANELIEDIDNEVIT